MLGDMKELKGISIYSPPPNRFGIYIQLVVDTLGPKKKSSVTAFDIWFESEDDARKAINSLNDEEVKALCWMGDE